MPSVNYRGWTTLDEDDTRELSEYEAARADGLARRWSELNHQLEQESFERQARFEEDDYDQDAPGDEYPDRQWCETDEEYQAALKDWDEQYSENRRERRARRAEVEVEMEFCVERLGAMGLRLMREYEWLNEDEDYYRLAESGNFPSMLYA